MELDVMLTKRIRLSFKTIVKSIALKNVFILTQSSKLLTYELILEYISSIMANLMVLKLICNKSERMFILTVEKG